MPSHIDITGERFGRLVVLSRGETRTYQNHRGRTVMWECICDCGSSLSVAGCSLRTGQTQSCGCLHREIVTRHGESTRETRTPEYTAWVAMKARCSDPNHPSYPHYGGRGITVCKRWQDSFADFLADVGRRPRGLSIDRKDNNGNYEPGNVRWATRRQQSDNQGHHDKMLTFNGQTHPVKQWAKITGLSVSAIHTRIRRGGWSVERTLTTPKMSGQEQAAATHAKQRESKAVNC